MPALHRHDRVGSTQDLCFALAETGAESGTAVLAAEQEGGRGRRGQRWASPRGGLWLSVLYRPVGAPAPELLSVRAGLAIAAVLDGLGPLPPVRLKWPNDLIVADHKVGGILCEAQWTGARLTALVVGVGINVRNPVPDDARVQAIALDTWLPTVTVEQVLGPVLAALQGVEVSTPGLDRAELAAFARRDWLDGQELAGPVEGVAVGLATDGALQVRRADGSVQSVRTGPIDLRHAHRRQPTT